MVPKLRIPFDIPVPVAPRRNLIANPSFELGTDGWTAGTGVVFGPPQPVAEVGDESLHLARASTTGHNYADSDLVEVEPGKVYSASFSVNAPTVARFGYIEIHWLRDDLSLIGQVTAEVAEVLNNWVRVGVTGEAPDETVYAEVQIGSSIDSPALESHYFDAVLFEEADAVADYFDGSFAGYEWAGVAHASVSDKILTPTKARTVDQDSKDEIAQCVYAILATEPGTRTELPEFGFASQLFRQGGVDLEELRQAVEEWEPRAQILTESEFEGLVQRVKVTI